MLDGARTHGFDSSECATSQLPIKAPAARRQSLLDLLTMFPDPLPEARKIDQWRATIRSDSSDICHATLAIVAIVEDGKTEPITLESKPSFSLGANNILLYTIDSTPERERSLLRNDRFPSTATKLRSKAAQRTCAAHH